MVDEPNHQLKIRKLHLTSETVRERAQKTTAQLESGHQSLWQRLKHVINPFGVVISLIFKPVKFIGHYVIPPYFRNSWRELKLVTWPNRKQSRQLTLAVIMFSVVIGAFVALLDFGFGKLFKEIIIK